MGDPRPEDLTHVIENHSLSIAFQPILSLKQRCFLGVEALTRAQNSQEEPLNPGALFTLARSQGLGLALDRLSRQKALKAFAELKTQFPNLILFLNLDTSILAPGVVGSGVLHQQVTSMGISPQDVVIEIIESQVEDSQCLETFVRQHRELGYLLALDDFGSGHSNLERITLLRPDILKLDRSLIAGVEKNPLQQAVLKAVVDLTQKVGGLALAEGTESSQECVKAMELGADLVQGFFFSRPHFPDALDPSQLGQKLQEISQAYVIQRGQKIRQRQEEYRSYFQTGEAIVGCLSGSPLGTWAECLEETLGHFPNLECGYLMDAQGAQVGPTVFSPKAPPRSNRGIFKPAQAGEDHSMKDYFIYISSGFPRFCTDPYVSLATGRTCLTLALPLNLLDQSGFILGLDFLV